MRSVCGKADGAALHICEGWPPILVGTGRQFVVMPVELRMPPRAKEPETYYKIREVANFLGVCERTVRRWIEREELRAHRFGRGVRISRSAFNAFVRRR